MKTLALSFAIVAVALGTLPAAEQTTDRVSAATARADGMLVFWDYCAGCHGRSAQGNGPQAKGLRVPPPDLTKLAERNGGVFPAAAVSHAIAGDDLPHRDTDMPAWAKTFSEKAPGEDGVVARKIEALTLYLEFIQHRPRK